jgi:ABC-type thiamin/hydroxymethylpyrimidine transport system permease subunit/DMSO/TMAO reductase YedYZ molybdopterin-dependent catalytic subunit
MQKQRYYFSTRDLLMMAALAALGGVTSTYVNAIGDFFQSILGFAGTTQWAAGLHVLWIVLAVGLTGKQGAGTITGLLKGGVELLSGNTHGLLVVLIDLVAGLLVDLGFLPFRNKDSRLAYLLAGGLAAASNVFVFQLFAALPADILAYGALLLVGGMALLSGSLLGGLLGHVLANTLRRVGVVRDQAAQESMGRRAYPIFLAIVALLIVALGFYLHQALRGPAVVHIGGAVAAPYDYPAQNEDLPTLTAAGTLRGVTSEYKGIAVRDLLARAQPRSGATLLLVKGTDGYSFFISMVEVQENGSLLLAPLGKGSEASYDLVGAQNSKAWVRAVQEMTVIEAATLQISGALDKAGPFDPNDWQFQMDSARLDVGAGPHKYQGVPLGLVLQAMNPRPGVTTVAIYAAGESTPAVELELAAVLPDKDLRLYTIIDGADVSFALARIDGQVLVAKVGRLELH